MLAVISPEVRFALFLVAVVLFVLSAVGSDGFGRFSLVPAGLAAFALPFMLDALDKV